MYHGPPLRALPLLLAFSLLACHDSEASPRAHEPPASNQRAETAPQSRPTSPPPAAPAPAAPAPAPPASTERAAKAPPVVEESPDDARVDLRTASLVELCTLPGIGETRARAILDLRERRPLRSVQDLRRVHGIGPATIRRIQPLVTVSPPPPPSPVTEPTPGR